MTGRARAAVRVLRLPHVHPDAVRVEVDCRHATTGLTGVPSDRLPMTRPQFVAAAVLEHEARCGACDTARARAQGDGAAIKDEATRACRDFRL